MKKSDFPKQLYVVMQKDEGDIYPVANEYLQDIPEDEHEHLVAIYELKQVSQFIVTKGLK